MARVRLAGAQDVLRIVDMIEALRVAVGGPIPVDRAWTAKTVSGLIQSQDGFVAVSDGGFIAGAIRQTIISPVPVAAEMGWFATDGNGLRLLRAFERWATDKGAELVQLSTGPDSMDLSRVGYRPAELAWVK